MPGTLLDRPAATRTLTAIFAILLAVSVVGALHRPPWPAALGGLTACATLLGGAVALRLGHEPIVPAFSGGVVVAVALLLVLPEASELLGQRPHMLALASAAGFFGFFTVERLFAARHPSRRAHPSIGVLEALGLVAHSFLDGFGIGVATHARPGVALVVLVAVMAHDVVDGINTVTVAVVHGNPEGRAALLVLLDAAAPIAGVVVGAAVAVGPSGLGVLLAVYAGFFLHVGATELLPRGHATPSLRGLVATWAGVGVVLALSRVSGV